MENATWVLAIFTGVLAVSTIAYTVVSYYLFKGSHKQIEALEKQVIAMTELASAVKNIPLIEHQLKERQKVAEKLQKMRDENSPQRRAVTGR